MISFKTTIRTLLAVATLAGISGTASAQDFTAMINQALARQNAAVQGATNRAMGAVQQNMSNPQVLAAYRSHVAQAQARGQRPLDLQTFAYNWTATAGFTNTAQYYNVSNQIVNNERAAFQALQAAQANRANAIAGLNQGFSNNQQEAGRQLMGQGTFRAPNGYSSVLPTTWAANSTQFFNGNTYHVDGGGRYYALSNGTWIPLSR